MPRNRTISQDGDLPAGTSAPADRYRPAHRETLAADRHHPASLVAAKGSINLRIEGQTRQLIDDAAAILGKTRTEFMVESARQHAVDVLLEQRLFALDPQRYDAFMHALDTPPAPGPKLRALLCRVSAWAK